jgi:hypothetical protein
MAQRTSAPVGRADHGHAWRSLEKVAGNARHTCMTPPVPETVAAHGVHSNKRQIFFGKLQVR